MNIDLVIKNAKLNVKSIILTFCFLVPTFNSFSQDSIRIQGQLLHNTKFPKVVVKKFGIGAFDVAAVPVNKETGVFKITAPLNAAPGIYRLQYSQSEASGYVDVIINGKENEIQFTVDVEANLENHLPVFSQSKENSAFYTFEQERQLKSKQIALIENFIATYPTKEELFYKKIVVERAKKIKDYQTKRNQFIVTTPFYYAKQLAKYTPNYFPEPTQFWRLNEFEKHYEFWKTKTTNDTLLINTPLYTDAILNYVSLYLNPQIDFSETEKNEGFKKCVDTIMNLFSENEKTKEFALKYLQMGFKEIGNENVLQYIDENYAATAQCTADDDALQKRLKGYETLKIGNLAPIIELTANDGSTKTLSDYPQEQVIVVFWASWCPHCMEEMPQLQEWAKNNKNNLVLAISLDEDYNDFQQTVAKFPDMLHNCDLQKWNGKITSDYYVAATPTFFVLDKERKIVGKYSNVSSLIASQNNK